MSKVLADEVLFLDALPGGMIINLTDYPSTTPEQYGWTIGNCQLKEQAFGIDISKILNGNWLLAVRDGLGAKSIPFLEPFTVNFFLLKCTFVHISYDPKEKEIKMEYKCRDSFTKDFRFEKCQYYVKFMSNRQIKYEIGSGCPFKMQLKQVFISNTDYKNYVIIRGCVLNAGRNMTFYQFEYIMVLVKHKLDEILIQDIMDVIRMGDYSNRTLKKALTSLESIESVDLRQCNCRKYSCKTQQGLCYPMELLRYTKPVYWSVPFYPAVCLLLLVLSLPIVIYKCFTIMKCMAKWDCAKCFSQKISKNSRVAKDRQQIPKTPVRLQWHKQEKVGKTRKVFLE